MRTNHILNCVICDKSLTGRQTRFCSATCKSRHNNTKHQNYENQKQRGFKRKQHAIQLKGGKCQKCGYDRNITALCFHHIGPKTMKLDMRTLSNTKPSLIEAELENCVLLCHNCHMETHYPEFNT